MGIAAEDVALLVPAAANASHNNNNDVLHDDLKPRAKDEPIDDDDGDTLDAVQAIAVMKASVRQLDGILQQLCDDQHACEHHALAKTRKLFAHVASPQEYFEVRTSSSRECHVLHV